jgi:hypothetical protein
MEQSPIEVPTVRPAVADTQRATNGTRRPRTTVTSRGRSADTKERRAARKIRFTAAEWRVVEERAHACGRAPARYVREVALGAVPKVSRTRANAPIIRELGALTLELQRVRRSLTGSAERVVSEQPCRGETECETSPVGAANEIDAVVGRMLTIVRRMGR